MKKLLLVFAILFCNLLYSQSTVSTYPTLAANNGSSAVTFQLVTPVAIEITSLQSVFSVVNSKEIYYRPGGVLHAPPANPGIPGNGWVLHETVMPLTTNGTLIPSNIPLTNPLILQPGTYGFCINSPGGSLRYRSWVAPDPSSFTDGTVTLHVGVGFGFGGTLTGWIASRALVGSVTYNLLPQSPNDVGIASIDTPAGGCEGLYNVVVTVKNHGINQVDTLTVDWTFNGQPQTPVDYYQVLDTFNGTGSTTAQINLGSVTLTGGQADTIVAWTSNPNNQVDTVNDNDTVIKGYFSSPTVGTFPYYQDFESGQADWVVAGTASSWAFGTPAKTNIIGTASGVNAFVTGGLSTGFYNISENSQVNSPCFDMRDFEGTPWVALNVNWFSEDGWDGAALQSSVDGGKSWQNVGKFQDPNNWFNDNSLDGRPGGSNDGWAGIGTASSSGWKRAKHVLPLTFVGSVVNFRIAFGSDASIQYDGFAFDNFTLVDFRKPNLGPDTTSFCGNPTVLLDPSIPLNGGLAWSDGDSSSLTKTVNLPGQYWVSHTDTMINETGYDSIEIIQSPAPQIAFENSIDTISIDDQITLNPNTPYDLDYTWTPGGLNIPFLLVKASDFGVGTHVFNLLVVDSVLCEDSENHTVVILDYTGIEDQEKTELSIYPNPVESTLVLDLRNVQSEKVEIRIFDVNGKLVYSSAFGISDSRRIELDLSSFETGPYMLQMNSDQQSKTLHIIKK